MRMPPAREPPRIDERAVRPETREQLIRGRRLQAMPSNPPHGDHHFKLDYVIGAYLQEGFVGSTDLLTRSSEQSDFATDTCIRRGGVDPSTDTRYLEELAFEVVNEQSLRDVTEQAEELSARGVRRIVAIFVKKGTVSEWSPKKGTWQALDPEGMFSDPTLARPLRVKELLDAAEADNAVARALVAKHNAVIEAARAESRDEGKKEGQKEGKKEGLKEGKKEGEKEGIAKGKAAAVLTVLDARGVVVSAEARARILACFDDVSLSRWLSRVADVHSAEELLTGD
jgi:hypothetical protein